MSKWMLKMAGVSGGLDHRIDNLEDGHALPVAIFVGILNGLVVQQGRSRDSNQPTRPARMAGMPASMALIRAMRNGCSPRLFGMVSKVDEKTLCTESAEMPAQTPNQC